MGGACGVCVETDRESDICESPSSEALPPTCTAYGEAERDERRRRIEAHRVSVFQQAEFERRQRASWRDVGLQRVMVMCTYLPVGVVMYTEDGSIGFVNDTMLKLAGRGEDDIRTGNHLSKLLTIPDTFELEEFCFREVSQYSLNHVLCGPVPVTLFTVPLEINDHRLDGGGGGGNGGGNAAVAAASAASPPGSPALDPAKHAPLGVARSSSLLSLSLPAASTNEAKYQVQQVVLVTFVSHRDDPSGLAMKTAQRFTGCPLSPPPQPQQRPRGNSRISTPPEFAGAHLHVPQTPGGESVASSSPTARTADDYPDAMPDTPGGSSVGDCAEGPEQAATGSLRPLRAPAPLFGELSPTHASANASGAASSPAAAAAAARRKAPSTPRSVGAPGDQRTASISSATTLGSALRQLQNKAPPSSPRHSCSSVSSRADAVATVAGLAGDITLVVDPVRQVLCHASPAAQHLLCLGPNEVAGRPCASVLHHSEHAADGCDVHDTLTRIALEQNAPDRLCILTDPSGGEGATVMVAGVLPLGPTQVIVRLAALPASKSKGIRFKRESGLPEEVASVVDALADATVITSLTGQVLHINRTFGQLFECELEDVMHKDVGMFIPTAFQKSHAEHVRRLVLSKNRGQRRYLKRHRPVVGQTLMGQTISLDMTVSEMNFSRETVYYIATCRKLMTTTSLARYHSHAGGLLSSLGLDPSPEIRGELVTQPSDLLSSMCSSTGGGAGATAAAAGGSDELLPAAVTSPPFSPAKRGVVAPLVIGGGSGGGGGGGGGGGSSGGGGRDVPEVDPVRELRMLAQEVGYYSPAAGGPISPRREESLLPAIVQHRHSPCP